MSDEWRAKLVLKSNGLVNGQYITNAMLFLKNHTGIKDAIVLGEHSPVLIHEPGSPENMIQPVAITQHVRKKILDWLGELGCTNREKAGWALDQRLREIDGRLETIAD